MLEAALESGEDGRLAIQPGADDKWKTELRLVLKVVLLEQGYFGKRKLVEPGGGLFASGRGGESTSQSGATDEVGMRADESLLGFQAGSPDSGAQGVMQLLPAGEGTAGPRFRRDPRGMFEDRADEVREGPLAQRV